MIWPRTWRPRFGGWTRSCTRVSAHLRSICSVTAWADTSRFALSEELAQPMTCAQAQAFAWFKHQMELSDGGDDDLASAPAECERSYVAKAEPGGDREVNDEDK